MKKLLLGLALLTSMTSFAADSYKCTFVNMKKALFNTYVYRGFPKSISITGTNEQRTLDDFSVSHYFSYRGKGIYKGINYDHAYWLNGDMTCDNSECSLNGKIHYTTVMYESDFEKGSATSISGWSYDVKIEGRGQQLFSLEDDNILKISCK